ncbi:MAG: S8 family serine peptidase, partial [Planctomycetota bacterium]
MPNRHPQRRRLSVAAVFVIALAGTVLAIGRWSSHQPAAPTASDRDAAASAAQTPAARSRPDITAADVPEAPNEAVPPADDTAGSAPMASPELREWLPGAVVQSCRHEAAADEARGAADDDETVMVETAVVQLSGQERPVAVRQVLAGSPEARRVLRRDAFIADRVLVKLRRPEAVADLRRLAQEHDATIERRVGRLGGDLYTVRLARRGHAAVEQAVEHFSKAAADLAYAEPDHLYFAVGDGIAPAATTPDDPDLSECWGLHNTGQTDGTEDADIDAPEAWDIATGSHDVVVAVIDTGIDYNHPDLEANMWTNPDEIPGNGIDDDNNGYVDDVYGWDFANNDSDPMDDHLHGTHCAGTIGAVGDDGYGISGVCWSVKLMALRFLGGDGSGTASGAVSAIEYAIENGAHVTSNSWGGGAASQALEDAISAANAADVAFVAAAGNSGNDNDDTPHYPSSYDIDNVIAVAASDHDDAAASFSCYGAESVDLFAPGVAVYSTFPTYMTDAMTQRGDDTHYGSISGTSMATPHVAGAAALLQSVTGRLSPATVRTILLESVDHIDAFEGLVVSEGRLNIATMMGQVSDSWLVIPTRPTWNDGPEAPAVGNGNGFAEAGETLDLSIEVANIGIGDTLESAELRLTSNDSYVTIHGDTVELGTVAGLERRMIDSFSLAIAADTPAGHEVTCRLRLREGGATVDSLDFKIVVYAIGTVSGYVRDNQGDGVSGVRILTTATGDVQFSTYTDGDGHYVVPALEGHQMEIKAVKRSWFPDAARFTAPCDPIDLTVYPVDIRIIETGMPFGIDRFGHV